MTGGAWVGRIALGGVSFGGIALCGVALGRVGPWRLVGGRVRVIVIRAFGAVGHPVEALVEFGEVVDLLAQESGLVFDRLSLRVRGHLLGRRRRWGRWGYRRGWKIKAKPSAGYGRMLGFGRWC